MELTALSLARLITNAYNRVRPGDDAEEHGGAGKTMIYLTGDIHGNPERLLQGKYKNIFKSGDRIIICGDFGLIWGGKYACQGRRYLDKLAKLPCEVLFVDGNHENFDMLNSFPVAEYCGGQVHQIRQNVLHLMRGEIFDFEGRSFFCFGGATSLDKDYRIPYISWWPGEICSKAEEDNALNLLEAVNYKVDYVITHTAPKFFCEGITGDFGQINLPCVVADFLTEIYQKLEYQHWYFGHYHFNRTWEKYKCTGLYERIIRI